MFSRGPEKLKVDRRESDPDQLQQFAPVLFQQSKRRIIRQMGDFFPDAVRLEPEPVTYFLKKIQE